MKLAIGSDKSGFLLKERIKEFLTEQNIDFDDLGTTDLESAKPYYTVACKVAPLVQNKTYDKAILICGTGAGMSVCANKFKGIYAVACESLYSAKMCRSINDANILCMGGWIVGPEMGIEMTKAFMNTDFLQDLEDWRKVFLSKAKVDLAEAEDEIYD